jgi:glutathione S-transferase
VKVTARLLEIQYQEVNVEESKELKAKSQTGKFPILETVHGHTIFESISIAKYLARQQRGFYGHNDYESKCI